MLNNGSASGSNDCTSSSIGDTGNNNKWKNNHNNKGKKFVGESKSTEISFNETRGALTTFVNKKCPVLAYNIKKMVTLTKGEVVKTKLDYSGCKTTDPTTGAITWDAE